MRYDEWCKSLSPSSALRKAFHGEAIDFASFSQQYRRELDARRDEGLRLAGLARSTALNLAVCRQRYPAKPCAGAG
ncbi:hypothetical protein DMH17_09210 [Raoultella planticola]|nr:hypothetical protein [Raoultella planticola]